MSAPDYAQQYQARKILLALMGASTDVPIMYWGHLADDGRLLAASGIGPGTAIAREIRLAEMLIAKRANPPRGKLAAAETNLKSLLAA